MLYPKEPKRRDGYLQPAKLDAYFRKRLKKHRMFRKSSHWKRLATKDKAFVIAEGFRESKARFYNHNYILNVIIPLAKDQPVKFASGLGKTNTKHFFFGLGEDIETLFRRLNKNVEKFVRRIYYKNQLAAGADLGALGMGVGKNLDYFIRGMGSEGLLRFDKALQQTGRRQYFLKGLGENYKRYLDAVNKLG